MTTRRGKEECKTRVFARSRSLLPPTHRRRGGLSTFGVTIRSARRFDRRTRAIADERRAQMLPLSGARFFSPLLAACLLFANCCDFRIEAASTTICKLLTCEKWRVLVVPLLTERFEQLDVLKGVVHAVLDNCRWYNDGFIDLAYLSKHDEKVLVENFDTQSELDNRLNEFVYTQNETATAYLDALKHALNKIEPASADFGSYVLIATDFALADTTPTHKELATIDAQLKSSGVQMRSISLASNGQIGDLNAPINSQHVRRISSRFMQVALIERDSVIDSVRPCAPLDDEAKIRSVKYQRDFKFWHWLPEHSDDVAIGLLLFLGATLVTAGGYIAHRLDKARRRRLKSKTSSAAAASYFTLTD